MTGVLPIHIGESRVELPPMRITAHSQTRLCTGVQTSL